MGGPSQQVQQGQINAANATANLENTLAGEAGQVYSTTEPGLQTAENYYSQIASGNPQAIQSAIAPSLSSIEQSTNTAKQQAMETLPAGGALQEALATAPIQEAGQIGSLVSQTYAGSFPALENMAQTGIAASTGESSAATNAAATSASAYGNVAEEEAQGKATTMGLLGSLAGAAGTAATGSL